MADVAKAWGGRQYLVEVTSLTVSFHEISADSCEIAAQLSVASTAEGWLGMTIHSRRDQAPELTELRLIDGPRHP